MKLQSTFFKKLVAVSVLSLGLFGIQAFASTAPVKMYQGIDIGPLLQQEQVVQPVAEDPTALPFTKPLIENWRGMPLYLVTMRNGVLDPYYLVVPKDQKFRMLIINQGTVAGEFESNSLRVEKPLYPGTATTLFILGKPAGQYDYFDDFTPGRSGFIISK